VGVSADRPSICGHLMKGPGVPCGLPADHEPPHRPASIPATKSVRPVRNVLSHVERQDAAYREQLGVAPGGNLPSAIGGEPRVVNEARDTDRQRRGRKRRWSAVTTTRVENQARSDPSEPERNTSHTDEAGT
jgi:hypothetical protein